MWKVGSGPGARPGAPIAVRAVWLLALCAGVAALRGQGLQGHLEGTLRDEGGAPVSGATLVAVEAATGLRREAASDAEGGFVLPAMPAGHYAIHAAAPGMLPGHWEIDVALGENRRLDLRVESEAGASRALADLEAVPVRREALLESERTATMTRIYPDTLHNLPLLGRSFSDFAYLTPQAVLSAPTARAYLALGGQRGVNTAIAIDGADLTDPFFHGALGAEELRNPFVVSIEAVREFQVVTNGAGAESGRMGGGWLNAVTRSGSNSPEAAIFFYGRPRDWVARQATGSSVGAFRNQQFGAVAGGPISRDKLFYFVAADFQNADRPAGFQWGGAQPVALDPGTYAADAALARRSGDYAIPADARTLFARVDYYPSARQTLALTLNVSRYRGSAGEGPLVSSEAVGNTRAETATASLHWTWQPEARWINQFRLHFSRESLPRDPRTAAARVDISGVGVYGQFALRREYESRRWQFNDSFTWSRPGLRLTGGVDLALSRFTETFTPNAGGVYSFSSLAAFRAGTWSTYRQFFGLGGLDPAAAGRYTGSQGDYAVYVQGDWQPRDTLYLSAGLRHESQLHGDFPILDYSNPRANPLPLRRSTPSDSALSPRLALAWRPGGGRDLFRLSAGRYVSRTPGVLLFQVYTLNGIRSASYTINGSASAPLPWGAGFNPENPAVLAAAPSATPPPSDVYTFAPGFRNPRTIRAGAGWERQFGENWLASAQLDWARATHLERLRDINLGATTPNAQGRPVFSATRPNPAYRRMIEYASDASGNYRALTLGLRRRAPDQHWQLQVFYTWSRARDNDSNERVFSSSTTADPFRLDDEWAVSDYDTPHALTAYGDWRESLTGIRVGARVQYLSGAPYSANNAGRDLNGDGQTGNDRLLGTARNQFRARPTLLADLRLARAFRWRRAEVTATIDCFNLLNRDDTYGRVTFTGTDAAPVVTSMNTPLYTVDSRYYPTRQVQWGIRIAYK